MTLTPQWKSIHDQGIEYTHAFGPGSGFTWSWIGGCFYECRWQMGAAHTTVVCYAERIATVRMNSTFFPRGFKHYYFYDKARLDDPKGRQKPAGIFVNPMGDTLGHWVPHNDIQAGLDVCAKTPKHVFFLTTKNAPRLLEFDFPSNVWVGISIPPTHMNGKLLGQAQRAQMLDVALEKLDRVNVPVRWISAEPLAWDIAAAIAQANVQWLVIGAASRGSQNFQPLASDVERLLAVADRRGIPVWLKHNLSWPTSRAEYPRSFAPVHPAPAAQLSLFGEDS
jgi:protein gp37